MLELDFRRLLLDPSQQLLYLADQFMVMEHILTFILHKACVQSLHSYQGLTSATPLKTVLFNWSGTSLLNILCALEFLNSDWLATGWKI